MGQFIGMRRRANRGYRLIPVCCVIMHFGDGAARCADIGFLRGLFGFRDRRCRIDLVRVSKRPPQMPFERTSRHGQSRQPFLPKQ